jgi:hypothetical protein
MPDAFAYHAGFDLKTAEPLRVEVLAHHGGPVTVRISMAPTIESIHLTPDEARRLGMLLAHAAAAARRKEGQRPDTQSPR